MASLNIEIDGSTVRFSRVGVDHGWSTVPGVYLFARAEDSGIEVVAAALCDDFEFQDCGRSLWAAAQRDGATEVFMTVASNRAERERILAAVERLQSIRSGSRTTQG
jgi:hypothetical protein